MPHNVQYKTFDEISAIVENVQSMLVSQMQKKLEGQLTEKIDDQYMEVIQSNFDEISDLHSRAYTVMNESKQSTADAKVDMNEKRVELQDVMYERKHILEEIVRCRGFRSVYQDVELIPLEEFQQRAGPEYLENMDNPHQLMINRLKYELVVRTALKEQKEALELERTQLIKETRKVQKKVNLFDKLLDDFVSSAAPVEEALQAEQQPAAAAAAVVDNDIEMQEPETMDTTL